jgi:hypothetical protein
VFAYYAQGPAWVLSPALKKKKKITMSNTKLEDMRLNIYTNIRVKNKVKTQLAKYIIFSKTWVFLFLENLQDILNATCLQGLLCILA